MTQLDSEIETIIVPDSLDAELCQSAHGHPLNLECSVEVNWYIEAPCSGENLFSCDKHAQWVREAIMAGAMCDSCGKLVRDCWIIHPV